MMGLQKSAELLSDVWPTSSQLKERYKTYKETFQSKQQIPTSLTKKPRLGSRVFSVSLPVDTHVAKLKDSLIGLHTKRSQILDASFEANLRLVYKSILKEEIRIFTLLEKGLFHLLARVHYRDLPIGAVSDFISLFDVLLNELTKQYDDSSLEIGAVVKDACKVFGLFLISSVKYSVLSKENLEQLLSFNFKLTQYYLMMSSIVNLWFKEMSKEPDVMYHIHKHSGSLDRFPIFELAKDFLFMDERMAKQSKEIMLLLILITEFSPELETWLLRSDFPLVVITGLHSCFNQINRAEVISDSSGGFVEFGQNHLSNFSKFEDYVDFIMMIVSYASHENIKMVFLNALDVKFIDVLIEHYMIHDDLIVLILLLHFLQKILCPPLHVSNSMEFVVQHFYERRIKNQGATQGNLISLLEKIYNTHQLDSDLLSSILCIFKSFLRLQNPDLIIDVFGKGYKEKKKIPRSQTTEKVRTIAKYLCTSDELYALMMECLHFTITNSSQSLTNPSIDNYSVIFDPTNLASIVIINSFYNFFNNTDIVNSHLIELLLDLACSNKGFLVDVFSSNQITGENSVLLNALLYNWNIYDKHKSNEGVQVSKFKPDARLFNGWTESINHSSSTIKLKHENLAYNIEIFEQFIISLYSGLLAQDILYS